VALVKMIVKLALLGLLVWVVWKKLSGDEAEEVEL
jgi:hypothetical protein